MKFILFLICLLPFSSLTFASNDTAMVAVYQELCAKEPDPLKRQNYCFLLENRGRSHASSNRFRQDRATA